MKKVIAIAFISIFCFSPVYSWNIQKTPINDSISSIFFIDNQNGWAVSWNGQIISTSNGGEKWQIQYIYPDTLYNHFENILFLNSSIGWVVGGNGIILKTHNGGNNWEKQGNFGVSYDFQDVCFISKDAGFIIGQNWNNYPNIASIIKTENGGTTWEEMINDSVKISMKFLQSLFFIDGNIGWLAGENNNGAGIILKTIDGGKSWSVKKDNFSNMHGGARINSLSFIDSLNGYAAGYSGMLLKTTNGGEKWEIMKSAMHNNFNSIYFVNKNKGWAVGNWNRVFFTKDGGEIWERQDSPLDDNDIRNSLEDVFFINDSTGWIASGGGDILHTTSSGFSNDSTAAEINKDNPATISSSFQLFDNFPNPFNSQTTITYSLQKAQSVAINIYNIKGELIRSQRLGHQSCGIHKFSLKIDDLNATQISSGIYFYEIKNNQSAQIKSMLFLK